MAGCWPWGGLGRTVLLQYPEEQEPEASGSSQDRGADGSGEGGPRKIIEEAIRSQFPLLHLIQKSNCHTPTIVKEMEFNLWGG